jgi:hypothetical protein
MKTTALNLAFERLERARRAFTQMEQSTDLKTTARAWFDFLLAVGGLYAKIEQGAKGCPQSEGWFGRKKNERKKDELLRYLHHARNAEEHGIESTTLERTEIQLNALTTGVHVSSDFQTFSPTGPGDFKILGRHLILKEITHASYGKTMPPTEHLGHRLTEPSAIDAARLGLAYMESFFAEATKLPQRF